MKKLISIYCQERCPIGKKCCFGEVYADTIGDRVIRERHKCEFKKKTGMIFVDTVISNPAA